MLAMNLKNTPQHNFAGLDDWFEIFKTGDQTDSKGRKRTFTDADLDSMVANHSGEHTAPLVVGHPKSNDPAYGWLDQLKVEGGTLFAKAKDVVTEFSDAVKNKHFPNRSVSIIPEGDGFKVRHIGFLGAAAPAVPGLAGIDFADADDDALEFSMTNDQRWATASGFSSIADMLGGFRDWMIGEKGLDIADRILPRWNIDNIRDSGREVRNSEPEKTHFSNHNEDVDVNKEFTQADLDKAVKDAEVAAKETVDKAVAKANYQAALSDATAKIKTLVSEGKLLPAQTPGLAEFMAGLSTADDNAFEFAASKEGEAAVKKTPAQFMGDFMAAMGVQIKTGKDTSTAADEDADVTYSAPSGFSYEEDRAALHAKALEYQQKHKCDYVTAASAVEGA